MFEPIGPMSSLANKMGMLRTNGWYTSVDDLHTFFENTLVNEPLEMNYTFDGYPEKWIFQENIDPKLTQNERVMDKTLYLSYPGKKYKQPLILIKAW